MTMTPETLRAGTAVVTGANAGLGRALVEGFLAEGMQVAGIARNKSEIEAMGAELGDSFLPVFADVGNAEEVVSAFGNIRKLGLTPTVLINNAAVFPRRDILEETPDSFMDVMSVNLGGMFFCCHAVLPDMIERGLGRIINVSTFAHLEPAPTEAAYAISKGAAHLFTRSLVAELKDRFPKIVINDWIPGELNTAMGRPDGLTPQEAADWGVKLALWDDPMLTGRLFNQDHEVLPPLPMKKKLINKLLGRKRTPLRVTG